MSGINKFIFFAAIALIAVNLTGCGDKPKAAAKPPLVKTMTVQHGGDFAQNIYPGTVRGRYESKLSFQVGGRVLSRNVQPGSFVKAGETLMTLDPRDVIQQSGQGDAQAASALAELELAKSNLSRFRELYDAGAVSASTLEQYQTNYNVALAAYDNAKAQAAKGHNALNYAYLTANADGVVTAVSAEEGQVVAAGQTVLSIAQTGELEVEIHVPENHLEDAVIGNNANIGFWALKDDVTGVIREVSPMADTASRTYTVRISLLEPPQNLQLGMTASVALAQSKVKADNSCMLPLSAIYQTGGQTQVWVVDKENKAQLKDISVKEFGDNQVAVLGLHEGEKVITAGVHNLREGQEVRLTGDKS